MNPRLFFTAGFLTTMAASAAVPDNVAGTVFLDHNGNGRLDPDDKPLAGIKVSDGVNIVTTGADGKYAIKITPDPMLPVPGTQVVALCWPSGKWPTGKHWFRLKDMADPGRCDFGLREVEQRLPFTYLHVSDSHDWRASPYQNQSDLTVSTLREAAFIINTGDLGFGGSAPEEMEFHGARLLKCMGQNPMPTIAVIGNHDTDSKYGPDHEYSTCGGFAKFFGPLRWSFDYAGVHFVFVDALEDNAVNLGPTAEWLDKELSLLPKDTRTILSFHYPTPGTNARFIEVLRKHKIELVHAGHNHAYKRYPGCWPAPMVTAFARSAGALNVMRVDANGTHVGFFCDGCARGAHNYQHSRRCPVAWRAHFVEGIISRLTTARHEVADQALDGGGNPVPVATAAVYVTADLRPTASATTGIRIKKSEGDLIEVAYEAEHLSINGVRMPFVIPPDDDGLLRLQVFAHKGMLTVWANESLFFEEATRFQTASSVAAFSNGGPSRLVALKVLELRPDADNHDDAYACACGHGAILRGRE